MSAAALLPPPRPRGLPWAGLLALAFVSGALGGAAAAVAVVHRAARQAVRHPELRVERATRFLTRRLSLDADQEKRVRDILEGQAAELGKLRQEVWPRVLERLDATDREVAGALRPAQRQRWRALVERLRRNWLDTHPPPQ